MKNSTSRKRRAAVIGASSGMGSAVAIRLHADGYQLLLADLSVARLTGLASRLGCEAQQVDIADDRAVSALAAHCTAGVDALVITAGLSASMASFERIVDVNLGGTARVLNTFANVMSPGGVAVCFASIAGHLAGAIDAQVEKVLLDAASAGLGARLLQSLAPELRIPGMAYALSKLGVLKLAQRTGVDWGKRQVRVCSVSPGVIDTPMGQVERDANPEANVALAAAPIPRLGTAEEVADVVAFLCSPQASYMTACDILVDGGWVGAIQSATGNSPIAEALAAAREKAR